MWILPSFGMASESNQCNGRPVIEVVVFSVNNGVTNNQLLLSAKNVSPLLRKFTGFKSRTIGQDEKGKWVDIVHWENMNSAMAASDAMMKNKSAIEFFSLIDQKGMSINHFCAK